MSHKLFLLITAGDIREKRKRKVELRNETAPVVYGIELLYSSAVRSAHSFSNKLVYFSNGGYEIEKLRKNLGQSVS